MFIYFQSGSTASGSIVSQHRQQIVVRSREIRLVRDGGNYNDSGYGFTLRQRKYTPHILNICSSMITGYCFLYREHKQQQ